MDMNIKHKWNRQCLLVVSSVTWG